jgi:hypothetical protein
MTQTIVPEQHLKRLIRNDKSVSLAHQGRVYREGIYARHALDREFEDADIASRVQRKRDERAVYREGVQLRRNAQEAKLCLPFPVGHVAV